MAAILVDDLLEIGEIESSSGLAPTRISATPVGARVVRACGRTVTVVDASRLESIREVGNAGV